MTISVGQISRVFAGAALIALGISSSVQAQFSEIRIGDVDGFGYGTASGWLGTDKLAANRTGGLLGQTDLLPDINEDGLLAAGAGDDFDLRTAAEIGGNFLTGSGFTDTGSTGSQFTDISLSTTYGNSSASANVLIGSNFAAPVFGAGGLFPKPPSSSLSNQPGFEFRFDVNKSDIIEDRTLFFNVLFGDYDVVPATLNVTINNGSGSPGNIINLPLVVQPADEDGLIQGAFSTLNFSQVFSDGGSVWNGFLNVDFNAPNEPYTAFDFVEVSLNPILPESTPEPSTILGLLTIGGIALGVLKKKQG